MSINSSHTCVMKSGMETCVEACGGTKGYTNGARTFGKDVSFKPFKVQHSSGMVQEHVDLLSSIRGKGEPLNKVRDMADATLCSIAGRIAT